MMSDQDKGLIKSPSPEINLHQSHWTLKVTKIFSAVIFGLIIPGILTFNVMGNLAQLEQSINSKQDLEKVASIYRTLKEEVEVQNQYALASYLFSSAINQNTLINKQIMKTVAIHIGFSVISFGVLFIILGINQGSISASGTFANSTSIDFKSGSMGVGVILIGGVMVTTAAIHTNEYTGVSIPAYKPSEATLIKTIDNLEAANYSNFVRSLLLRTIENTSTESNNSGGHNKDNAPWQTKPNTLLNQTKLKSENGNEQ
ncbi:hypothetical protein NH514_00305 [Pseudoalteromonas sp. ACER1]|uniref:hypothetical protein n=1 Tax=unclassified Pseudoalteromonas TaxID=194690 RepID=UPI001F224FCC|nr:MULTISPECIES: hypothetical protein [unclassified Pseudoalteromonas]MCF2845816.1 hypothetical protein [Pseudoalteromonas sp. PAST1]MCO7209171.1 hypothetical protein [Pseudoalteromonas sp. ACER1]